MIARLRAPVPRRCRRERLSGISTCRCFPADYVTDDAGTGFVHTAPGHGADDYNTFVKHKETFAACGTPEVPHTVGEDSSYLPGRAAVRGRARLRRQGQGRRRERGRDREARRGRRARRPRAPQAPVPAFLALEGAADLPQHAAMVHRHGQADRRSRGDTLRHRALAAIKTVQWVPPQGQNRITGMIEATARLGGVAPARLGRRRSRCSSSKGTERHPQGRARQRGRSPTPSRRRARTPGLRPTRRRGSSRPSATIRPTTSKVRTILDVWFDSGSTHAFTLEVRDDLKARRTARRRARHGDVSRGLGPAPRLVPLVAARELRHARPRALRRRADPRLRPRREGPEDVEVARQRHRAAGRDQADRAPTSCACGSRRRTTPTTCASGRRSSRPSSRPTASCATRCAGCWARSPTSARPTASRPPTMPELERFILHRLAELDDEIREAYAAFDYKRVVALLNGFMTGDLSAFYFDVRKDALYCDPISSLARKSALTVIDETFRCVATWLAPILVFTAEEAWLARYPSDGQARCISKPFPTCPAAGATRRWRQRWAKIRRVRRVVTGALEIERAQKRIGASLEAAPVVYVADESSCGRSRASTSPRSASPRVSGSCAGEGPAEAFRLDDVKGVAVVPAPRRGAQMRPLLEDHARGRRRPGLSRRDAARRAGAARVGAARARMHTQRPLRERGSPHDLRPPRFLVALATLRSIRRRSSISCSSTYLPRARADRAWRRSST